MFWTLMLDLYLLLAAAVLLWYVGVQRTQKGALAREVQRLHEDLERISKERSELRNHARRLELRFNELFLLKGGREMNDFVQRELKALSRELEAMNPADQVSVHLQSGNAGDGNE